MPVRLLQAALLLAAGGALVLLLSLFGTAVTLAGLAAMALGTVLAAPAAREADGGWWKLLAAGTVLAGAGEALALLSETVGGLLSVLGAATAMAAAVIALPPSG